MTDELQEAAGKEDVDINFDCPLCGKNISIDARGAGLMITCPDCHQEVLVPVPVAGDEVAVVPVDEADARVPALQNALAEADSRRERLVAELEAAQRRVVLLEKSATEQRERFEQVSGELVVIQNALDRMVTLLQDAGVRDV